ncbi:unnamed protein product [Echinostoma caproni]|uniref:Ras-GEF domain-containing protein n=1 Tax=Echinostoma caproni TaxID=27848 RepID=A0A183AFB3_9TREM|nr:unnamed protein product [Echinostoma caproni]
MSDTPSDLSLNRGSVQYSAAGSLLAESSPVPRASGDGSRVEAERFRNLSVGDEFSGSENSSRFSFRVFDSLNAPVPSGSGIGISRFRGLRYSERYTRSPIAPSTPTRIAATNLGYVNRIKNRFESSDQSGEIATPPSRSDSLASTSSVPTGYMSGLDRSGAEATTPGATSSANDLVPELVVNDWSDDPEMVAGESFEAAVELQRHFPDYQMPAKGPKSEDYIRLLCLLEFHQKTQYMVRHLKQYEYLLLRCWPVEHRRLAHVLCLDQIPELICLFRTLVKCIDQTKTPQGYSGMGEAVYAWLTDNGCANLKSWAQHCQALSCSNMLDSVRVIVRDYARRNPDIVPLLETRHNKFVLIEGLKQMRILYFNLPLIANNIVKDLEKTKSYKAEAKIWRQIHAKLASLPQTIDDVCMPLVKRINRGQLYTNLDKKDAIFRQNHSTIAPFENLLLNFPRVLFHYWVVAHAEVTVDKLTVTSANKVNHDYIRERTEMLAIMLHNALMFLVKDNERYILRAFKVTREHGSGGGGGGGVGVPSSASTLPSAVNASNVAAAANANNPSSDSRSPLVHAASATSANSTERASFHLSSSSFSSSGLSPQAPPVGGSLSTATGSSIYNTLFGGGSASATVAAAASGVAGGHSSSPSLTTSPQPSGGPGGVVGAAANMAG